MSTYEKAKRSDEKADNSNGCSSFVVSELLEPQQPNPEYGRYAYNFCDLPINDPTVKPERNALLSSFENLGGETLGNKTRTKMENDFGYNLDENCDTLTNVVGEQKFLPTPVNAENVPLQGKGLRDNAVVPQGDPDSGTSLSISKQLSKRIESSFGIDTNKLLLRESLDVSKMGARATAQGNVIRFAPGQFKPDTHEGLSILGHELAHVQDQAMGNVHAPSGSVLRDAGHETRSDAAGVAFASGLLHRAPPVSLDKSSAKCFPVQYSDMPDKQPVVDYSSLTLKELREIAKNKSLVPEIEAEIQARFRAMNKKTLSYHARKGDYFAIIERDRRRSARDNARLAELLKHEPRGYHEARAILRQPGGYGYYDEVILDKNYKSTTADMIGTDKKTDQEKKTLAARARQNGPAEYHTEHQIAADVHELARAKKLRPGATLSISGQFDSCGKCIIVMERLANKYDIIVTYSDSVQTMTFMRGQRRPKITQHKPRGGGHGTPTSQQIEKPSDTARRPQNSTSSAPEFSGAGKTPAKTEIPTKAELSKLKAELKQHAKVHTDKSAIFRGGAKAILPVYSTLCYFHTAYHMPKPPPLPEDLDDFDQVMQYRVDLLEYLQTYLSSAPFAELAEVFTALWHLNDKLNLSTLETTARANARLVEDEDGSSTMRRIINGPFYINIKSGQLYKIALGHLNFVLSEGKKVEPGSLMPEGVLNKFPVLPVFYDNKYVAIEAEENGKWYLDYYDNDDNFLELIQDYYSLEEVVDTPYYIVTGPRYNGQVFKITGPSEIMSLAQFAFRLLTGRSPWDDFDKEDFEFIGSVSSEMRLTRTANYDVYYDQNNIIYMNADGEWHLVPYNNLSRLVVEATDDYDTWSYMREVVDTPYYIVTGTNREGQVFKRDKEGPEPIDLSKPEMKLNRCTERIYYDQNNMIRMGEDGAWHWEPQTLVRKLILPGACSVDLVELYSMQKVANAEYYIVTGPHYNGYVFKRNKEGLMPYDLFNPEMKLTKASLWDIYYDEKNIIIKRDREWHLEPYSKYADLLKSLYK